MNLFLIFFFFVLIKMPRKLMINDETKSIFFSYFIFRLKYRFKNMDSNCIFLYLSNYHFGEFVLSIFFFSRD